MLNSSAPAPTAPLPTPPATGPDPSERVHTVGEALIDHQESLKAAIRLYAHRRDMPTTQDEVDETFSALADRALQNAGSCTPDKVPVAWLKVMALHLVQERRRQLQKVKPFSQTFEAEANEEGQARSQVEIFEALRRNRAPASSTAARTCGPSLDDLLPLVPPAYHDILRASITEALEAPAISERTGQKIGAVYTQLCRARQALRAAWSRWQSEN